MKKIIIILGLFFIIILGIVFFKTLLFTSKQSSAKPISPEKLDTDSISERLASAIRFQTVSSQDTLPNEKEFLGFHAFLEKSFPLLHKTLTKEVVNKYSLLYTWKGNDPNLKPILLMGHIDVVPAENESKWEHLPFAGAIADGYIWGRGSLDDKSAVMGVLEATEHLLKSGFSPKRTIYLSFGHDEETTGKKGAFKAAALLKERNIEFEFIQDEGMFIADGYVPGVPKPVAIVGMAQKGYVTVELIVEDTGGHSSSPPSNTAVGILSKAIVRLEENPIKGGLDGIIGDMFDSLGPEMSLPMKLIFANRWLFGGLIEKQLSESPGTNANLRTTTAATMFHGSDKENVLPQKARALVNFRIHPRDDIQKVLDHVKQVVNDSRVKVDYLKNSAEEPSPVSPINSPSYEMFTKTIKEVFPDVLIAPGLFIAGSDTQKFISFSKNIYRFHPLYFQKSNNDEKRMHGTNERISVRNYEDFVRFYIQLIRNSSNFTL
ncbi:MAG: M20/M25/M40 family metallo-hydrolase [Leptospiraceae bacterium]|nr:M20 family peptidase [Leptospiraceae bacterium]MCP5493159.1 M20/M25/M40 family metallo-hydrolase [Leptospiraceae bacterium]